MTISSTESATVFKAINKLSTEFDKMHRWLTYVKERVKYVEVLLRDTTMNSSVSADGDKYKAVVVYHNLLQEEGASHLWKDFVHITDIPPTKISQVLLSWFLQANSVQAGNWALDGPIKGGALAEESKGVQATCTPYMYAMYVTMAKYLVKATCNSTWATYV